MSNLPARLSRIVFPRVRTLAAACAVAGLLVLLSPLQGVLAADVSADDALGRTWKRTDKPVAAQMVTRTWMWGPALTGPIPETAQDAPGGQRTVQYFDKSRMEISTDAGISPSSIWFVTNGLLARELITGQIQVGPNAFEQRSPASVNIAGDHDDSGGATYASFTGLLHAPPAADGAALTQRVTRDGQVTDDPALAQIGATAVYNVNGHQIANVFWTFMNSSGLVYQEGGYLNARLFENPFYATGYPITEPYWTTVRVAGTPQDVLVQVFERRVLTYNPANPPEWQVEAGNVGRHYYEWRHGPVPAEGAPPMLDFMDELQDQLGGMVRGWDGWNAVSVTDLQTGKTVSVYGERPQFSACTVKIFMMMAVAQDIEAGKYSEDSVYWLVQDAMGPSNTWPARELIKKAGGGDVGTGIHRINAIMWGLGARQSIITHPPDYPSEEYGYAQSHGITDNLLTTNDLNQMLGKLYHREALSAWATDYVLWSMTIAVPGQQYSLGGGIGAGGRLYHKIGLLYAPLNTWNDAGIVTFTRNGQEYAYAISYLGGLSSDWHNHYDRGAAVSGAAWRAFQRAYP